MRKQKRLLSDNLPNLYKQFKAETDENISFITIWRPKPFGVTYPRDADRKGSAVCSAVPMFHRVCVPPCRSIFHRVYFPRVYVLPCLCSTVSMFHRVPGGSCLCSTVSQEALCSTVSMFHRVYVPPCPRRLSVPPCLSIFHHSRVKDHGDLTWVMVTPIEVKGHPKPPSPPPPKCITDLVA